MLLMNKEEYESIKKRIRKRYELEMFYLNCQLETFENTGLLPQYPPNDLTRAIMDSMAYGIKLNINNFIL